jgi:phosphopantothenoylcysteine decarboxylase/phosphopantothenate--cysteine ligase
MRVLLGITGGIAAYKATGVIRLLTEAGHTVKVLPTQNALRFIGATTLEALSHNAVDPGLYTDVSDVKHIALAQEADLIIVAPASASFLARYASGLADDLLGNVLLATKSPVVVAPAMHTEMLQHEATQANISTLESRGVLIIQPATGRLTGVDSGPGRLPEPQDIVDAALAALDAQDLRGKRILITAGGTQENIDPVRFIGNRSSGKQGIALAQAAQARGAEVKVISANLDDLPASLKNTEHIQTAKQLSDAVLSQVMNWDCLIMAAAVSDYRVSSESLIKLKKSDLGPNLALNLIANPDILAESVKQLSASNSETITVGFAAETVLDNSDAKSLEDLARQKLASKGCTIIVANNVANGQVFGKDTNSVLILTKKGGAFSASGTKRLVANQILDVISDMLT